MVRTGQVGEQGRGVPDQPRRRSAAITWTADAQGRLTNWYPNRKVTLPLDAVTLSLSMSRHRDAASA
jgi:hypothetical protein